MIDNSKKLFSRAQQTIPGGVNSPVRAFKSVGGTPLFIKSASGAMLEDEDGNQYIDYINSWGPMIMGHAWPKVSEALRQQLDHSLSYGAPTKLEVEMAELICSMVPGLDMIRMVNSGTEACMSALRLARGFTGRNKVIKYIGCYHGHADSFLVSAGSGLATLNIQSVPGVTASTAVDTLTASYNDLAGTEALVNAHKNEIAAIIIEPVAGNMGCIPPTNDFLQSLRALCDREGILLIFDEVMTGFRLAPGGAQELYGVRADLATYGKIIGGGLPVGAYGGRRDIMEHVAPKGNVYQAGTLSGNPLAMRAGFTLLSELNTNRNIYKELDNTTAAIEKGLIEVFNDAGVPVTVNRVGSMISLHFSNTPIHNFAQAAAADNQLFNRFFHHCLDNGIYLPPSAFETWFVSHAITSEHVQKTIDVARSFTKSIA